MNEASQGRSETLAIVILSYGILGGLLSSFACCCWPAGLLAAWMATRRVSNMGLLPSGGGAAFGLRIGLVMGLVMASFGAALSLVQMDEEQMAVIEASVGEVPFSMVAVMMVAMLGSIGLVGGVVGGALGASGTSTQQARGPRKPPRRISSVSGVATPPPPRDGLGSEPNVPAPSSKPPEQAVPRLRPEDFVTAERDPGPASGEIQPSPLGSRNAEVTITIDEDLPRPETELAEWQGDSEDGEAGDGAADPEPGDDS
ncbi:MAG: hypothetical protein VX498_13600 [Myxococcota bacterium]|nr:hypothetical protein [Myxococcota bacterium]